MKENKQITDIKINNLWGLYNYHLKLKDDVTILIGKNGTGKSTLLNLLAATVKKKNHEENIDFDDVEISFSDGHKIKVNKTSFSFEKSTNSSKIDERNLNSLLKMINDLRDDIENKIYKNPDIQISNKKIDIDENIGFNKKENDIKNREIPNLIKFSTFDMELKNKQFLNTKDSENEEIKTELDLILYKLINDFKLYQLKIKNILEEENKSIEDEIKKLSSSSSSSDKELSLLKELVNKKENRKESIYENILNFKEILSNLFQDTNKSIDIDENNSIVFRIKDKKILPYNLSSGEKQILSILLTVLLTEENFCYLIMDEPEISLHVEWQSEFIDNLKKLNKNMQIIIATHSPAIVTKGWKNNIIKMKDVVSLNEY